MKYLLSIIIPTKNRSYYCLFAIRQIVALGLQNVEICIQDNSDTDELREGIEALGISDIVYHYHPGILSFVDNFNEAVSLAHGDYLCMIGDDDGILPSVLLLVEEMEKQEADAAIPALNYVYFWPNEQKIVSNGENGVMISHLSNGPKRKEGWVVNSTSALNKLLNNGIQHYTSLDMPRLYHGIVKRDSINRIKETVGHYFGGLTPDMYMSAALSFVCTKVIRVGYSVTISGICPSSGSSDSATGKHTGELKQAPHFRGHKSYQWDALVPQFYSVDTIWADTLFHAIRDFKKDYLIDFFNKSLFAGICLEKYPEFKEIIIGHAKTNNYSIYSIYISLLHHKASVFLKRVSGKIERFLHKDRTKTFRTYNIPDILVSTEEIKKKELL